MICQLNSSEKNLSSDPRVNSLLAPSFPSSSSLKSTVSEAWRYNIHWDHENESQRLKMTDQKTPGNLSPWDDIIEKMHHQYWTTTSRLLTIDKNQFLHKPGVWFSVICNWMHSELLCHFVDNKGLFWFSKMKNMKKPWFVQVYLLIHSTKSRNRSMKKLHIHMKKDVHICHKRWHLNDYNNQQMFTSYLHIFQQKLINFLHFSLPPHPILPLFHLSWSLTISTTTWNWIF